MPLRPESKAKVLFKLVVIVMDRHLSVCFHAIVKTNKLIPVLLGHRMGPAFECRYDFL